MRQVRQRPPPNRHAAFTTMRPRETPPPLGWGAVRFSPPLPQLPPQRSRLLEPAAGALVDSRPHGKLCRHVEYIGIAGRRSARRSQPRTAGGRPSRCGADACFGGGGQRQDARAISGVPSCLPSFVHDAHERQFKNRCRTGGQDGHASINAFGPVPPRLP